MTKRIMIVDDDPDIRLTVRMILKFRGFEIVEAGNGSEALEKLREKRVDLVLIDFFMPGMSGRDLASAIRSDPKLRDLKLAFLTVATFRKHGRRELEKLGSLDYIRKPFDKDDLVRRVRQMVGE
jgi:CheY-like chemotaxis protein